MKLLSTFIILSSLLFAFETQAQFRCAGSLVDSRFNKLDIKRYCGEPEMKDSYTRREKIILNGKEEEIACTHVEQWYFSYGVNKTTVIVEFVGGFVTQVRQGRDKP